MKIVGSFAFSHAGLTSGGHGSTAADQSSAVCEGFYAMGRAVRALEPDAIVLLAAERTLADPYACVAQFIIGTGETAAVVGDDGIARSTLPVHQRFAQAILETMLDAGVDLAFSEAMRIDHSLIEPILSAFVDRPIPIVPIAQNCNCPPLPPLFRSRAFGVALRYAIGSGPAGRVVVIGTGSLPHGAESEPEQRVPRRPVGTRINGGRKTMILLEPCRTKSSFDRLIIDLLCAGRSRDLVRDWTSEQFDTEGGSGAQELRNWISVASIANDARGDILLYEPVPNSTAAASIISFS